MAAQSASLHRSWSSRAVSDPPPCAAASPHWPAAATDWPAPHRTAASATPPSPTGGEGSRRSQPPARIVEPRPPRTARAFTARPPHPRQTNRTGRASIPRRTRSACTPSQFTTFCRPHPRQLSMKRGGRSAGMTAPGQAPTVPHRPAYVGAGSFLICSKLWMAGTEPCKPLISSCCFSNFSYSQCHSHRVTMRSQNS